MEVEVIRKTERPERLVCQAGRGDYYQGYIGDTEYAELMESVDYDEENILRAADKLWDKSEDRTIDDLDTESSILQTAAKTNSFIEKQLSRGHYGLWEHPQITFAVKGVSRVTMAQITRHRHLTFDIQSMRYADFSEQEIIVPATLLSDEERHERYPHIYDEDGNHFNRDEGVFEMDEEIRANWYNAYVAMCENQREMYQDMVDAGIPKEDARFMLPLGTSVNMTFSGNARTMMHLFNLRQKANSQWEIRELTNMLADRLEEWMPYTGAWWDDRGPMKISP